VTKLYESALLYKRLKTSFKPETSHDFVAELKAFKPAIAPGVAAIRAQQAGQEFNKQALDKLVEYLGAYDIMSRMGYPLAIPPLRPDQSPDAWESVGSSLLAAVRTDEIHPAVNWYATMTSAFEAGNPAQFNQAVAGYHSWLTQHVPKAATKGINEQFFNHAAPFYKATILYLLAFLFACVSWFNWSDWLRRSGFYLLVIAWLVHSTGLIFRMVLEGRPPVTNLYSSAIFIGWGAVILGMILERFYRDGIGTVVGASMGFITQIIAHNLALGGDTMEMLRAVLDTNFWLATHVVVVTLGYASTFVAGFLAIIYLLRGLFTTTLNEATARALTRMVYGIICFAALFSFVGTVLGGIWADQSWGRFWGWDPKENGALIIVIWNALILHARWGGMVRERGLMNMAIFGNIVTSFSWFGVNMLGIGLHSYGFMDSAMNWLVLFVSSQVLLIILGLLPRQYWRSFREQQQSVSQPAKEASPNAGRAQAAAAS
jgi:ABC-type transport system involved in cytochrome c biogenesis permease subunit